MTVRYIMYSMLSQCTTDEVLSGYTFETVFLFTKTIHSRTGTIFLVLKIRSVYLWNLANYLGEIGVRRGEKQGSKWRI